MGSWVDSIMSPLKSAGDVAKGLVDIRDTVKFGDAVIKLQAQILAAQQGALAAQSRETEMAEEIRCLKARVAEVEAWDVQKNRYRLEQLPPGVFVYTLKTDKTDGEPMHHLCQKCYEHGKRSILQSDERGNGIHHLTCNECSAVLRVGHYSAPRIRTSRGDWS